MLWHSTLLIAAVAGFQLAATHAADAGSASATARRLFEQHCADCHGADGRGTTVAPDLANGTWQYGGSPEDIHRSISNGRRAVMPALGAALGDAGLAQLIGYVRSLSGSMAIGAADLTAGEALFAMFCASCHGETGQGTQALGAPDLTDDVWLYGDGPAAIRDIVTQGRASEMPSFNEVLGADNVAELTRYVLELRNDKD